VIPEDITKVALTIVNDKCITWKSTQGLAVARVAALHQVAFGTRNHRVEHFVPHRRGCWITTHRILVNLEGYNMRDDQNNPEGQNSHSLIQTYTADEHNYYSLQILPFLLQC
jgi:hypothetical protein